MACRVGHLAEQRQLGGDQEAVRVGLHEDVIGLLPISPRRRLAPALDAHHTTP
jgi:hypothetical protein